MGAQGTGIAAAAGCAIVVGLAFLLGYETSSGALPVLLGSGIFAAGVTVALLWALRSPREPASDDVDLEDA